MNFDLCIETISAVIDSTWSMTWPDSTAELPTEEELVAGLKLEVDGTLEPITELSFTYQSFVDKYNELVAAQPWKELREKRDKLLADTDWWASADRTMTAEQTAYRQALRDLPANTVDPENPVWPTKP